MNDYPDPATEQPDPKKPYAVPAARSAGESEPEETVTAAPDDGSPELAPDPWLDAPEPGRPLTSSPSVYGPGPQDGPGADTSAEAAPEYGHEAPAVPDPWAPKQPPSPVPMPGPSSSGGWSIPRVAPPQPPAPMPPAVAQQARHADDVPYRIPRVQQDAAVPADQTGASAPQVRRIAPRDLAPPPPPAQRSPGPTPPAQRSPQRAILQHGTPPRTGPFTAPVAVNSGAHAVAQDGGSFPPNRMRTPTASSSVEPLDLDQAALLPPRKEEPNGGWRRALYKASFGGINPGISKAQAARNALVDRVRTPVDGCHKIAVVSLKGGIGKTTTTSCLGLTLAHYRGDRVVALDANPDAGTLAERLTGATDVSVRTMLDHIGRIDSFTDISRYMSLAGRLQVLASDQDAEISDAFDADQYTEVIGLLARYYNVVLTDSGTGMLHSAMKGTLEQANSLVVVGAPSVDGSSRASKTLDWLVAHGYGDLVAGSVAVISSVREKSDAVDMDVLRSHFSARCRTVVEIPYDPHLVVGGRIDMTQLESETELAYVELAAAVADGFRPDPLR